MALIKLPGEQAGVYGIAGLFFLDGECEVDRLSVKQAYTLQLLGADISGVEILPAPAFEDVPDPEPAQEAPSRSSAADLEALGSDPDAGSIADLVQAVPELEEVEEAGLEEDQYNVTPTVESTPTDPALQTPEPEPTPEPVDVGTGGGPDAGQQDDSSTEDGSTDADAPEQPLAPEGQVGIDLPVPEPTEQLQEPETGEQPADTFPADAPEPTEATASGFPEPAADLPTPAQDEVPEGTGEDLTDAVEEPTGRHVADDSDEPSTDSTTA